MENPDPNINKYSAILKDYLKINSENEIHKVVVKSPDFAGENMTSVIEFVTIHFKAEEKAPLSLFVKRFGTNPEYNEAIVESRIYDKEASFFNQFLVDAKELCFKETGKTNLIDFFPKCFYADKELIVLENLAVKGFVMHSKEDLMNQAQTECVLTHLAQFHAVSHVLLMDSGIDSFQLKYPDLALEIFAGEKADAMMGPMFDNGMESIIKLLKVYPTDGSDEALSRLSPYIGKLYKEICGMLAYDPENDTFLSLNHGDMWVNNMMFGPNGDYVLLDMQTTRIASPSLDLSYFLFSSVKPEVRRANFSSFMKYYFQVFEETVRRLNRNMKFSFEDFQNDYKTKSFMGLLYRITFVCTIGAMGNIDIDNIEGDLGAMNNEIHDSVSKWIINNPSKSAEIAKEVVASLKEWEEY